MEAVAKTKYLKGSPRKARLVIDLVRGKNVAQALAILKFTNKRAATPVAKCIRSAVANATYSAEQQNIAIDPDDLWIKTCYVDIGPTKGRKRLRPAPQGRAYQERRHYCHITVELTSEALEIKNEEPKKKGKKAQAKMKDGTAAKPSKMKETSKKTPEEKLEKPTTEVEGTKKEAKEAPKPAPKKPAAKKTEKTENNEVEDKKVKAPVEEEAPKADTKPLAAKTDEEKTSTEKAADAQVTENEELEKQ